MSLPQRVIEATRNFLNRRKMAYHACFPAGSPTTELVLSDLAKFCRANTSTFHPDSNMAARLDGRREVFLRVAQHLNLSTDDLMRLYAKVDP